MGVILGRIDERLIHGQMALAWLRQYPAEVVIVVNDQSAKDPLQTMLLQMAVSGTVICEVVTVTDAKAAIELNSGKKIFLCARTPDVYVRLLEMGVKIPQINVGGLYSAAGRTQYYKTIFLDEKLKEDIIKLGQYPVKVEHRMVPQDAETDIIAELKKQ